MTLKNRVAAALLSITLFQGIAVLENNCSLNKEMSVDDYSLTFIEELQDETGKSVTDEETLYILNGAYENQRLTDEDKSLIYGYCDLLDDNSYLDKESSYNQLNNVEIVPYGNYEHGFHGTLGKYINDSDTIKLYSDSKDVETHEILHCIFQKTRELFSRNQLHLTFRFSQR